MFPNSLAGEVEHGTLRCCEFEEVIGSNREHLEHPPASMSLTQQKGARSGVELHPYGNGLFSGTGMCMEGSPSHITLVCRLGVCILVGMMSSPSRARCVTSLKSLRIRLKWVYAHREIKCMGVFSANYFTSFFFSLEWNIVSEMRSNVES